MKSVSKLDKISKAYEVIRAHKVQIQVYFIIAIRECIHISVLNLLFGVPFYIRLLIRAVYKYRLKIKIKIQQSDWLKFCKHKSVFSIHVMKHISGVTWWIIAILLSRGYLSRKSIGQFSLFSPKTAVFSPRTW